MCMGLPIPRRNLKEKYDLVESVYMTAENERLEDKNACSQAIDYKCPPHVCSEEGDELDKDVHL